MLPRFRSISIFSFSPVKGVRRAATTPQSVLDVMDMRGPEYREQVEVLTKMTRQPDAQLRLKFGLMAIDQAPSPDLAGMVPLEMMILQSARESATWTQIQPAPAANFVLLDWPSTDANLYETRLFVVGSDSAMSVESLPNSTRLAARRLLKPAVLSCRQSQKPPGELRALLDASGQLQVRRYLFGGDLPAGTCRTVDNVSVVECEMKMSMKAVALIGFLLLISGCTGIQTTKPGVVGIDRTQYMFDPLPSRELNGSYARAYRTAIRSAEAQGKLVTETPAGHRVMRIAGDLVEQVPAFRPGAERWGWFVNLIDVDMVNANCGPGGKIIVYTGLLNRLKLTDDELAIVLAHEIAHGIREHTREQISSKAGFEIAGTLGAAALGAGAMGKSVISKGLDAGFGLSFSRRDESEADLIGLELSARAGYDPRAAITLWSKMAAEGKGNGLPQFLSSHPSDEARSERLQGALPKVMPLYEAARLSALQRQM